MGETHKGHLDRADKGHYEKYLKGDGIDIGCGGDLLRLPDSRPVKPWDTQDGDAQFMSDIPDDTFDFVYSSHALEHMVDVSLALKHWTRIIKPGGFLYVVVPDYLYYEKLTWPSRYNGEHLHSFSLDLTRRDVKRNNHWHVAEDVAPLLGEILESGLQHDGFNYNRGTEDQTLSGVMSQIYFVARK